MAELVRERLTSNLERLQLSYLATALDTYVAQAMQQQWSYTDFLDHLVEEEVAQRESRRVKTALKLAGFPFLKTLDGFDFAFQPSVAKARIQELATLGFVERKENVIFLGPPGVGKTHLAIALGVKAVQCGFSAYFTTLDALIKQLRAAEVGGQVTRKLKTYLKPAVLMVDEVGYLPLERKEANLVFQLVSGRYEKGAIVLTSRKPFAEWGEVFGDEVLVTAMLDRLLHHAEVFSIRGHSYRLRGKRLDGAPQGPSPETAPVVETAEKGGEPLRRRVEPAT
jgi:DNA replication protein DnaC